MRAALLALALAACEAPDRYFTSVSRGVGEIEGGGKTSGYDTEDTRLEIGVSGPLFTRPERVSRAPCVSPPPAATLAPAPAPSSSGEIPWTEIGLILGSVITWEGGRRGIPVAVKRVKRDRPSGGT